MYGNVTPKQQSSNFEACSTYICVCMYACSDVVTALNTSVFCFHFLNLLYLIWFFVPTLFTLPPLMNSCRHERLHKPEYACMCVNVRMLICIISNFELNLYTFSYVIEQSIPSMGWKRVEAATVEHTPFELSSYPAIRLAGRYACACWMRWAY